jgi:hypothetical protein
VFDVFTEEIEVQIKSGIANLYWYRKDLKKAWLRSGVDSRQCDLLFSRRKEDNQKLSKRELMDILYEELRTSDYNRRLEVSRNFVRILVEHENFVPQAENHRVEIAERCALKLREIIAKQQKEQEYRDQIRRRAQIARKEDYASQRLKLNERFLELMREEPHKRGYALQQIFTDLMRISGIPVEHPFKIVGEQIDGAIKYDGHYYLVELKWTDKKASQGEIAPFCIKVEGKLEARGIFISMNAYSKEVLNSLPKGKNLKLLLLDGMHLTNVLAGLYTIQELLEHAISQASLRGEIYCSHDLSK